MKKRNFKPHPDFIITGQKGESAACEYLLKLNYIILCTNYRAGHKEIDIVALDKNRLVFVEVKTRMENTLILPQNAVDRQKQRFIIQAARSYIRHSSCTLEGRFDIICVQKSPVGTFAVTEHIKEAFSP